MWDQATDIIPDGSVMIMFKLLFRERTGSTATDAVQHHYARVFESVWVLEKAKNRTGPRIV